MGEMKTLRAAWMTLPLAPVAERGARSGDEGGVVNAAPMHAGGDEVGAAIRGGVCSMDRASRPAWWAPAGGPASGGI